MAFLPRRVDFAASPVTSMCREQVDGVCCEFRGKINGIEEKKERTVSMCYFTGDV
jgi:hypothetical protein